MMYVEYMLARKKPISGNDFCGNLLGNALGVLKKNAKVGQGNASTGYAA